jgi:hypothetical protein
MFLAVFQEQEEIAPAVLVGEEDVLAAVAALGDMVRHVGDHDSRYSGHGSILPSEMTRSREHLGSVQVSLSYNDLWLIFMPFGGVPRFQSDAVS